MEGGSVYWLNKYEKIIVFYNQPKSHTKNVSLVELTTN